MAKPVPPLTIRLALLVSIALALLAAALLVIGAVLRWGGCWACGG